MQPVEILYLIVAVAVVVLAVALVWLILDLIKLSRSLRAIMTGEVKEKVLMVSEAIDRIGTLASHFIGLIEEAEKQIRDKSEQISQGLGMVVGISDALKKRKTKAQDDEQEQEEEESSKNEKTQEKNDKNSK